MSRSGAKRYIINLNARRVPVSVGNKALNLVSLMRKGLRVPQTYVVCWEAYDQYVRDDVTVIDAVRAEIRQHLDASQAYAVRSSASIEDTLERSFAGQFKTVLAVKGEQSILQAVWSIWATAQSAGVRTYLHKLPEEQRELHMAVILQEMVKPVVSGVAFSRNPMTGEDQVVVEAVQGPGTALVQDGATPLHWVRQREEWKARPEQSPVEEGLIETVAAQTRQIARLFKREVDLEWVYDGHALYWVQMREISSLNDLTVYSNRIAKEVLPGMIKPLVWSVNVPLVNTVWVRVLTELVGKNDLKIDDMARSFYYRAYFNLSALGRVWNMLGMPREGLEIMMGILPRVEGQRSFKLTGRMVRLIPRLLVFLWKKRQLGRRFEREYPVLAGKFTRYDYPNAPKLSEVELVSQIDWLYGDVQQLVYFNILIPMLMALTNLILENTLRRAKVDPARYDMMENSATHLVYDPGKFLKELRKDYAALPPALQGQIAACSYAEFQSLPGISAFQGKFVELLQRFGHLSDSGNDFSTVPWREKPDMLLKLVSQQVPAAEIETAKIRYADLKLQAKPLLRIWLKGVQKRARQFRLYREQVSSLYTYAYGLFRPYFLALGERLVARGVLPTPGDIFYLSWAEVREVVSLASSPGEKDYGTLARARQVEMESCREVVLPALVYGEVAPVIELGPVEKLCGVPTSRGYYSGSVKVVQSLADFSKLQVGDVLIIPYSDVGWTPLFARAGAVVSESGGMLSHSSIVAREYQIPAVVSVAGAMQLRDHTRVTVDGYRGEVILHAEC